MTFQKNKRKGQEVLQEIAVKVGVQSRRHRGQAHFMASAVDCDLGQAQFRAWCEPRDEMNRTPRN